MKRKNNQHSASMSMMRLHTAVLTFLFLDVFMIIPILAHPFQSLYIYILGLPIIIMNIWAVLILAMPRILHPHYALFRGIFGIVASLGCVIVQQKFAHQIMGDYVLIYTVSSFLLYGVLFFCYIKRRGLNFRSNHFKGGRKSDSKYTLISTFTGIGYLVANLSLGFINQQWMYIVLIMIYFMLAVTLFHFIMELPRYLKLKK
ncbi:hypothetical protein D3C77_425060 [compost metagenome]